MCCTLLFLHRLRFQFVANVELPSSLFPNPAVFHLNVRGSLVRAENCVCCLSMHFGRSPSPAVSMLVKPLSHFPNVCRSLSMSANLICRRRYIAELRLVSSLAPAQKHGSQSPLRLSMCTVRALKESSGSREGVFDLRRESCRKLLWSLRTFNSLHVDIRYIFSSSTQSL